MERASNTPIAWKDYKNVGFRNNTYYCGTGGPRAFGQRIVEKHAELCIEAGVGLMAYSAESMPGMWRFELEQMETLKAFDDWVIAKYIMCLLSEKHKIYASFDSKPYYGQSAGPQLRIEVLSDVQTTSSSFVNSFETVSAKTEKVELRRGCEVLYRRDAKTRAISRQARDRIVKPEAKAERRSCTMVIERKGCTVMDGYALMADVMKL